MLYNPLCASPHFGAAVGAGAVLFAVAGEVDRKVAGAVFLEMDTRRAGDVASFSFLAQAITLPM